MITKFKLYVEASFSNVEVTPNNTTGPVGDISSTQDRAGYFTSSNDQSFGITFTPKGENGDVKSYKTKKIKKKNFKKNKKYKDEEDK